MMKCPKCGTEMGKGIAIDAEDTRGFTIVPRAPLNAESLKLIECFKCPKCGYSDDIENPKILWPELTGKRIGSNWITRKQLRKQQGNES